jgi:hypothetical protein
MPSIILSTLHHSDCSAISFKSYLLRKSLSKHDKTRQRKGKDKKRKKKKKEEDQDSSETRQDETRQDKGKIKISQQREGKDEDQTRQYLGLLLAPWRLKIRNDK